MTAKKPPYAAPAAEPEAKRCTQCGFFQIIEAFPFSGKPVGGHTPRSSWCRECWKDRSLRNKRLKLEREEAVV